MAAPTCFCALWPRLPVVVPTLNEARIVPHVFAQPVDEHEVFVVDGDSVDATLAVACRPTQIGQTARAGHASSPMLAEHWSAGSLHTPTPEDGAH